MLLCPLWVDSGLTINANQAPAHPGLYLLGVGSARLRSPISSGRGPVIV